MTFLCTQREKNTVRKPFFCLPATGMLICTVLSLLLLYWFLAFFHNYDEAKVYESGVALHVI